MGEERTSGPKGRIIVPDSLYGLKPVPTSPYIPARTYPRASAFGFSGACEGPTALGSILEGLGQGYELIQACSPALIEAHLLVFFC
jgi:hypothetical protein